MWFLTEILPNLGLPLHFIRIIVSAHFFSFLSILYILFASKLSWIVHSMIIYLFYRCSSTSFIAIEFYPWETCWIEPNSVETASILSGGYSKHRYLFQVAGVEMSNLVQGTRCEDATAGMFCTNFTWHEEKCKFIWPTKELHSESTKTSFCSESSVAWEEGMWNYLRRFIPAWLLPKISRNKLFRVQ